MRAPCCLLNERRSTVLYPPAGGEVGLRLRVRQHMTSGKAAANQGACLQSRPCPAPTRPQVEGLTCVCACANTCSLAGLQLTVHIAGVSSPGSALTAEDEKAVAAWGGQADVSTPASAPAVGRAMPGTDRLGASETPALRQQQDSMALATRQLCASNMPNTLA